jgi:hypothetical protein
LPEYVKKAGSVTAIRGSESIEAAPILEITPPIFLARLYPVLV